MALANATQLTDYWAKVTKSEKDAFSSRFGVHPYALAVGTKLYKYSSPYPYNDKIARWSPWWSFYVSASVKLPSGSVACPGLAQHIDKANLLGTNEIRMARTRSAVKDEWNDMTNLFAVQLKVPAYAMFGRCFGLPMSEKAGSANVHFIGGAYQLYIPELRESDMQCIHVQAGTETGKR